MKNKIFLLISALTLTGCINNSSVNPSTEETKETSARPSISVISTEIESPTSKETEIVETAETAKATEQEGKYFTYHYDKFGYDFTLPAYIDLEIPENDVLLTFGNAFFMDNDDYSKSAEFYSGLDGMGRCGDCIAVIGKDLMPTEEREEIGEIKPSGWHTVKYSCIEDRYLYNRCHLIGFQLSGENANEKNLITGTRYLNVEGMLPIENEVANYVRKTGNHVFYRVVPVFLDLDLVCRGVLIRTWSVEDKGESINRYVFCYNCQPEIGIDYSNGDSWELAKAGELDESGNYVLNTRTMKIHKEGCPVLEETSDKNKKKYTGSLNALLDYGYTECGYCFGGDYGEH